MPTKPFSGPKYLENMTAGTRGNPCVLCGRSVIACARLPFLRVADGGARFAAPGEEVAPEGDMGLHVIGPDCLRRHPDLLPMVEYKSTR